MTRFGTIGAAVWQLHSRHLPRRSHGADMLEADMVEAVFTEAAPTLQAVA
jgi:hypothetical protein